MEEYKRTLSFNGRYEVSKSGKIRNYYTHKEIKGTIGKEKNDEYIHIRAIIDGKSFHKRLHQLVMEVWGEPQPNKNYVIDHIDRNKLNNDISNLRWVSREENVKNSDYYVSGERNKKIEKYKFNKKPIKVNGILFESQWSAGKYIKSKIEIKQSVKNLCDMMYLKRNKIFNFKIEYL